MKNIYVAQFGTGTNLNLLPLAAGQLVSRLKLEKEFLKKYHLGEIIHRRTNDPEGLVDSLGDIFAIGFGCSLWNMNMALATAYEVRQKCPEALIVAGGPSIAKDPELVGPFFKKHPYVDVIVTGEGEEAWVQLLQYCDQGKSFDDIRGIVYKDRQTGRIRYGQPEEILSMPDLPSPFLDGTFDEFYAKYGNEFSGIIWETNRGCPFTCTFCTWGNYTSRKVRYNSLERIEKEIAWIGEHKISYIALTDANFGIKERDVEIAKMLAECKKKYGVPNFISVSWVKNSSNRVLVIADILRSVGIAFRVTLTFQSKNPEVLEAINRDNMKEAAFEAVRKAYHEKRLYSYTELIMALPLETYESYMQGIEGCLSSSVYEQIYIYPLFLFPNTELASPASTRKYGLIGKTTGGGYTKGKDSYKIGESVEIVIGTSTMPKGKWVEAFVMGFFTIGLHDDRLVFFITEYLKAEYGITTTDLFCFARKMAAGQKLTTIDRIFKKLERRARLVQSEGVTHLMEPPHYGRVCYDPPQAVFLELLYHRKDFFPEFLKIIEAYLKEKGNAFDRDKIIDLFKFQQAVMAHPDSPVSEMLELNYDWIDYFMFAFNFERTKLAKKRMKFKVVDIAPSAGDGSTFLKKHFDIRGVPAFNELYDESGKRVFPAVELKANSEVIQTQNGSGGIDENADYNIPDLLENESEIFVTG